MTNRQILAERLALAHWPALWAFAYPWDGRSCAWLRWLALRVWIGGLRLKINRLG